MTAKEAFVRADRWPPQPVTYDPDRIISVGDEQWYAPKCSRCSAVNSVVGEWADRKGHLFACWSCGAHNDIWSRDAHALREPQRLADRLRQIKESGW